MRVLVAEDSVLFREGLTRLLREGGHEIVAEVGDADALLAAARETEPHLCVVDIRMPPGMDSDGARAARTLRRELPAIAILLLSQHIETRHCIDLLGQGASGYLLKDRVLHLDDFLDAVRRVGAGGTAIDPEIVRALVAPLHAGVANLTPRELDVLVLAAEGHSNTGIAGRLVVSERTVETHMRGVFQKLGIAESATEHRRVTAVLAYLRATGSAGAP